MFTPEEFKSYQTWAYAQGLFDGGLQPARPAPPITLVTILNGTRAARLAQLQAAEVGRRNEGAENSSFAA
jgi:hypothetical protein